jgi:hypothetical protein
MAWPEDKKARYASENTHAWQLELDDEYVSKHAAPRDEARR